MLSCRHEPLSHRVNSTHEPTGMKLASKGAFTLGVKDILTPLHHTLNPRQPWPFSQNCTPQISNPLHHTLNPRFTWFEVFEFIWSFAQFFRTQQYKMYPILEPIIWFEKKGHGVLQAPPLPMHFSNITRALLSI